MIFLIPSPTLAHTQSTQEDSDLKKGHNLGRDEPQDPPEQNLKTLSPHPGMSGSLKYLLAVPLRPLWWSTIAFAGGVSLMMTFVSVVGEARGMSLPSATWFTYVAGAVAARLFGAKLPERVGPARLVAVRAVGAGDRRAGSDRVVTQLCRLARTHARGPAGGRAACTERR